MLMPKSVVLSVHLSPFYISLPAVPTARWRACRETEALMRKVDTVYNYKF